LNETPYINNIALTLPLLYHASAEFPIKYKHVLIPGYHEYSVSLQLVPLGKQS